jgi:hypothetical protein
VTPPCRRAQPSQRHADKVVQRLYYGERTGDSEYLNTMVLAKVEVPFGDLRERRTLSRFSNDGFGGSGHMQARPTDPPPPPARSPLPLRTPRSTSELCRAPRPTWLFLIT